MVKSLLTGKTGEAVAELREAIRLNPDDAMPHNKPSHGTLARDAAGQLRRYLVLADIAQQLADGVRGDRRSAGDQRSLKPH